GKESGPCYPSRRGQKRNRLSKPARTAASPTIRAGPVAGRRNDRRAKRSAGRHDVRCAPKQSGDLLSELPSSRAQLRPVFRKATPHPPELCRHISRQSKRSETAEK